MAWTRPSGIYEAAWFAHTFRRQARESLWGRERKRLLMQAEMNEARIVAYADALLAGLDADAPGIAQFEAADNAVAWDALGKLGIV